MMNMVPAVIRPASHTRSIWVNATLATSTIADISTKLRTNSAVFK
jgi:hypothetical protein